MLCILFIGLFACNKPVDDGIEINNPEPLQPGEVRIKAYPNEENKISFVVVSKKISIDWGDSSIEEFTPNGMSEGFIHEYTDNKPKHITLQTEEMYAFGAFSMIQINGLYVQTFGHLEEIIFGKCSYLEEVILRNNYLIRLEIEDANSVSANL